MERYVSGLASTDTEMNFMDYRTRLYGHYVSTHFASLRNISIEAFERQRLAFKGYFGSFLPTDKNSTILDIGCGYGSFLYFLQKEGYRAARGVDISPEQVEAARRLGLANVYCGDIVEFLQKHLEEFDCITAFDVIEHFPKEEILPLLDTISRALKLGGTLILLTPNAEGPFFGAIRYGDFTHSLAFTKASIAQILAATAFIDV
jgi:2-polyprenyl-3-methyl-5-hydroxy-6-metoxy-1,4-benzoquinol methylase